MEPLPHIVAVDDDESIRSLIADYLAEHGYRVTTLSSGRTLAMVLQSEQVAMLLLDVKLPGDDGFSLARKVRAYSKVPIIMLTGQGHEVDRVLGLELGADDYLVKPFSPRELLARIKAVLRRYEFQPPQAVDRRDGTRQFKFAGWTLASGTRKLTAPDGRRINLTNGEFALLAAFLRAPRHVLSRDQLLESSRLHDDIYDRSIDVQILRLRRKIEVDPNDPKLIRTERGAGYFFDCDVSE
jgi:DNA-binding response OmpR family regulator